MKSCLLKKFTIMCCTALYILLGVSPAFSDHINKFELDANAMLTSGANEDWETLFNGGGTKIKFTGIVKDEPNSSGVDDDIFTGGRKDIQAISQWAHKSGSSPDKDEITNAYAAAYNHNGDLIINFGADRISNKGDAFLGFWFFRKPVNTAGGGFNGEHTSATFKEGKWVGGDVLILANFPQASNASPEIKVDVWDETCNKAASNNPQEGECDAKNIRLIKKTNATCSNGSLGNNLVCAITNDENGVNDPTPSPWPYQSKNSDVANSFPYETFFEGGINITQLVGGEGCFSSFMAETRSSSSYTATLKDFVLAEFNLCSFEVAKRCAGVELNPDNSFQVAYEIDIYNSGASSFSADETIKIVDKPSASDEFTLEKTISDFGDGTNLEVGETITISGSYKSTTNGGSNLIKSATISLGNDYLPAKNTALSVTCTVLPISPLLTVEKNCDLSLESSGNVVVVKKDFDVKVCNTGDIPLDVSLTDDKDALFVHNNIPLDYAKPCTEGDAEDKCDIGTSCVMYTEYTENSETKNLYACQDDTTAEFIEAVPGDEGLCASYSSSYNPGDVPEGTHLSLSNTATATATSPIFGESDDTAGNPVEGYINKALSEIGVSGNADCQLCPDD